MAAQRKPRLAQAEALLSRLPPQLARWAAAYDRKVACYLPRVLAAASTVFLAWYFFPVFALLQVAGWRVYAELCFALMEVGPVWLAVLSLMMMAFGLLLWTKMLVDALWDFLTVHVPPGSTTGFINPQVRRKFEVVLHYQQRRGWSQGAIAAGLTLGVVPPAAATVTIARVVSIPWFCCVATTVSITLQALYMLSKMRDAPSLNHFLGRDATGACTKAAAVTNSLRPQGTAPSGKLGSKPNELWNSCIFHIRTIALLVTLAGCAADGVFEPQLPFLALEALILIGMTHALFYVLMAVESDFVDLLIDVQDHYSRVAIGTMVVLVAGTGTALLLVTGNIPAALVGTFSAVAWSHCAIECTAHFDHYMRRLVFAPDSSRNSVPAEASVPADSDFSANVASLPPPSQSLWTLLEYAYLVAVIPLLPGLIAYMLVAAPTATVCTISALLAAAALLGQWRLVDKHAKFLGALAVGLPFFHSEYARAVTVQSRGPPPEQARYQTTNTRIYLGRRVVLSGYSVIVWAMVGLLFAGLMETTTIDNNPKSIFDFELLPTGNDAVTYHINWGPGASSEALYNFSAASLHATMQNGALTVCDFKAEGVSMVELVLLATSAYATQDTPAQRFFFSGALPAWKQVKTPSHPAVTFHRYDHQATNTTAIVVMGTHGLKPIDWIKDLDIWLETGVYQLHGFFLPGLHLLPDAVVVNAMRLIGNLKHALVLPSTNPAFREYHEPLLEYVAQAQARQPQRKFMMLGHSLGGGIAKVVGAKLGLRAVAFNSPGMLEVRGKYQVSREALTASAVNVPASNDIVGLVGSQAGTIVRWDCPYGSARCHFPPVVSCHFFNMCAPGLGSCTWRDL
eukprot:m.131220 g.131220  ORF g.131220 m.131220 type:complete len:852 (+) comp16809_c0_seq1:300-2855(+)